MAFLESIEQKLNQALVTDAPIQLPESWRKWLATYAWIFAVSGFGLGLLSVIFLLPVLGIISVASVVGTGRLLFFSWLALLVLLGYVVVLGIAIPRLKRLEKDGWNLIFYSALFFLVYDVLSWLQSPGFGAIIGLIWNVAWAVVGLYFIFQIRSYFTGVVSSKVVDGTTAKKASKKPKTKTSKPSKKS